MITKKTAADIWQCYREIEAGKQLLQDIEEAEKDNPGRVHEQHLKDALGHKRNLQLGIPMGDKTHQLFDISPKLALSVIRAHIINKERELFEANERAHIELDSVLRVGEKIGQRDRIIEEPEGVRICDARETGHGKEVFV